jgi:hypothetical protein
MTQDYYGTMRVTAHPETKNGDVFYIDRVGNIYIKEEDHG